MLGFFSCGKEAVVDIPVATDYGEISDRNDDPQEGCRCYMTVTEVQNSDPGENDAWGVADFTNMTPDFTGLTDDTWQTFPGGPNFPLPTSTEEILAPVPGTHTFTLNWTSDNNIPAPENLTAILRIDCFAPNRHGVVHLATSVNHTLVWSEADSYFNQNGSIGAAAFFDIEFGCVHIPVDDGISL